MQIEKSDKTVDIERLIPLLSAIDGVKTVKRINKHSLRVSGKTYEGARVFVTSSKILITPDFSSGAGQRTFNLSILLGGLLLPLLAYYIFWHPKIKRFNKTVYDGLKLSL